MFERSCKFCSECDPVALVYHHIKEKERTVSVKMSPLGWELSLSGIIKCDEITNCDLVCTNCHRKLHAGQKLVARKTN